MTFPGEPASEAIFKKLVDMKAYRWAIVTFRTANDSDSLVLLSPCT